MARVALGVLGRGIRGRVGEAVYSRSLGGATVRLVTKPRNHRTPAQMVVRLGMEVFSRQWRTLTEAQRRKWNRYAAGLRERDELGRLKRLSGHNAFVRVNQNLAALGVAPVLMPPLARAGVSRLKSGSGKLTVAGGVITGFRLKLILQDTGRDACATKSNASGDGCTRSSDSAHPSGRSALRLAALGCATKSFRKRDARATKSGGGELRAGEMIFVRATPPRSAGQGDTKLFSSVAALNRGRGYGTLAVDVLGDYRARFGDAIGEWEIVGLKVKVINTATGVSGEYLQIRAGR